MFKRWMCKRFGHKWMGIAPFEHICVKVSCWRCWEIQDVHLTGPYAHTCEELKGQIHFPGISEEGKGG